MVGRILITLWAFFFGGIALLFIFPKTDAHIRYPYAIRPFLIVLFLASGVYGVFWLYRQGMKHAVRK